MVMISYFWKFRLFKAGLSTGHGNENRTIEQMNHRNGVWDCGQTL